MVFVLSLLLQSPLAILLHDLDAPLLVQTPSACFEDGTSSNGVLQRGQAHLVEVGQCLAAILECLDAIYELLEADVSVASLASKVAFFVCGVFHVLFASMLAVILTDMMVAIVL
jgi:hypothetical protein